MSVGRRVRRPAVAGTFYPADRATLETLVDRLVAQGRDTVPSEAPVPKAVVAPHAGYVYSGPVAATAYARLVPAAGRVTRVVMLGPAHRLWFDGLALPGADSLETPLGESRAAHIDLPGVVTNARAHADEHALEVHLPFVQRVLGDVEIVPLLVGEATPESVAETLDALWGDAGTLVIVSSDLSHFLSWPEAKHVDAQTAAQIEALGPPLNHDQACGATPINGLLVAARRRALHAECLDLRNSGDTAGPRDRVVGYGAFAFYEKEPPRHRGTDKSNGIL
jgi:AmmeMemoRadiSam system protein B